METGSIYKVLTGENVLKIERSVNEAFASDWYLRGGLLVLCNSTSKTFLFFQAVVKVEIRAEA